MKKWSKIVVITLIAGLSATNVWSQNKAEKLKQKQRDLEEKINNTKNMIGTTKNSQRLTIAELAIINQQINYREDLLKNISSQVRNLNQQIEENKSVIVSMETDLTQLKHQYSLMLQYAYKHRNSYHNLMFVFAAKDFNQAYHRVKYLKQFGDSQKNQVNLIQETQKKLQQKNDELQGIRVEKEQLANIQEEEKKNFLTDKEKQQQALMDLQKEEKKLKQVLQDQEETKRKLAREIKKAIEEEIRKQAEEERKKQAKAGGNKTTTTATTPKTGTGFVETPEGKMESTKFENNKGLLPWPVEKGAITSGFGKNAHPTLSGVIVNNNGIDIGAPKGAKVRSVFEGTVSSIFVISGAGKIVMVSHGSYRTVYANLAEVSVAKGQKIKTKQEIGTLLPGEGAVSEAHFEIWKITAESYDMQDPAVWLYKN